MICGNARRPLAAGRMLAYPGRVMFRRAALPALALLLALAWPAAGGLADQNAAELDRLFDALETADSTEEALQIEERIWRLWMRHEDADVNQRMARGLLLMNAGHLEQAYEVYDRMVKLVPDYAEAWNKRATISYFRGDLEGSMRDIRRTLALEPRHFGALSGMSLIFEQLGEYGKAIDALDAAMKIHPKLLGGEDRRRKLEKQREREQI